MACDTDRSEQSASRLKRVVKYLKTLIRRFSTIDAGSDILSHYSQHRRLDDRSLYIIAYTCNRINEILYLRDRVRDSGQEPRGPGKVLTIIAVRDATRGMESG